MYWHTPQLAYNGVEDIDVYPNFFLITRFSSRLAHRLPFGAFFKIIKYNSCATISYLSTALVLTFKNDIFKKVRTILTQWLVAGPSAVART